MRKLTTILLLMAASAAYAAGGGEGNNTGCNGVGNPNSPCAGNTNNGGSGGAAKAKQKQRQSQTQSITNSGNSRSKSVANSGGNTLTGGAQSVSVSGDSYDAPRIPVATAYAATVAPTAVCALAVSAGVQAPGLGVSFGNSYVDKNCELLEQVRAVHNLGQRDVAVEMLCELPNYRAARDRVGQPCSNASKQAASPPSEPQVGTMTADGRVIQ